MKIHGISVAFVVSLAAAACGGTSTGGTTPASTTPDATGAVASTDVVTGQGVWTANCGGCHSESEGGYGPRVGGLGWAPDRMRTQIRRGEGRMPGFSQSQISPTDLEALLAHIHTIGGVNLQ